MLSLLTLLFMLLLKIIFYSTLFVIVIFIGLRLLVEPVKGVCNCTTKLYGKTVLVTGGNSGIGLETARDLAGRGATVIIASRNVKKSQEAVKDIIETSGNTKVEYMHLDLSKFSSVREFVKEFNESFERLDILVNNAGAAVLEQRKTEDGIDMLQQVNYLGPLLLTHLLLDKIIASKPSRIVNVSSHTHFLAYFDPCDIRGLKSGFLIYHWIKYANSKLCQIFWMKALAKRLPEGVTINSLHPGVICSDLFRNIPWCFRIILVPIISLIFKNPKEGAQTTIHLCVAPELDKSTGGYYQDCKLFNASKLSQDEEMIERVWKTSLSLVGIHTF